MGDPSTASSGSVSVPATTGEEGARDGGKGVEKEGRVAVASEESKS